MASVGWALVSWVNVARDALGPNRLIVPMRASQIADAQLFYDRGNGIRAEDCTTVAVTPSLNLKEVIFPVPRIAIRELRFDPMPGAGVVEVAAPRLETATGRLLGAFPLSAVVARNQIASLAKRGDRVVVETTPDSNDPQLTFGLGAPLRVGTTHFPSTASVACVAAVLAALLLSRLPANRKWRIATTLAVPWATLSNVVAARPRMGAIVGGLLVLGVQMIALWPVHLAIDWPLWDEVNYAARGAEWANRTGIIGSFHSSPLYVASYGLLSLVGSLPTAIFLQNYLCKITVSLLLYFVLLRWWGSWVAAFCAAGAWSIAWYQLEATNLVYHSAFAWFLAALLIVDRFPAAALGCLLAATATRQEYQFALLATAAWLIGRAWSSGWSFGDWLSARRSRLLNVVGAIMAAVLIGGVLCISFRSTFGHSDERAWFAFQQHYALRAVQSGRYGHISPLLDYPVIIQKDFPGATSLRSAFTLNPGAFTHHVIANVTDAGSEVLALLTSHDGLKRCGFLLLLAGVLGLCAVPRAPVRFDLKATGSVAVAASALLVILPGMLVLSANRYLLPVIPLVLLLVGVVVTAIAGRLPGGRQGFAGFAVIIAVIAFGTIYSAPRIFEPGTRPRPVAESVQKIDAILLHSRPQVLAGASASSYAHYLGDQSVTGVEVFSEAGGDSGRSSDLATLLAATGATGVIVTADWTNSSRFDPTTLARLLTAPRWQKFEIPAGLFYLRADAKK
jgi:hypothetical protein